MVINLETIFLLFTIYDIVIISILSYSGLADISLDANSICIVYTIRKFSFKCVFIPYI